jgi:curli biogenesis system outer membrane secretion channel CsgG
MISKCESWKVWSCIATVILLFGAPPLAGQGRGGLRFTVVVDKFENKSEDNRELGDEWATMLTSALHESGHFIVVAQDDMQLNALKEQIRGLSGVTTQGRKTAARGQMSPAQLLVKGVITHFQQGTANQGGGIGFGKIRVNAGRKKTEIRSTIQMIDATTGALVAAKSFVGMAQGRAFSVGASEGNGQGNVDMSQDDNVHAAFEKAITEVIPWMVAQLPSVSWRGSVVKVAAGKIIINRGSREGVAIGDELIVGESEILRDPDTGEFLDEVIHERARIKIVQINDRTATCTVVTGDPSQIVTGMAIQYGSEGS